MSARARLTVATAAVTTAALLAPAPGGATTATASGSDTVEVTGLVQVVAGEGGEPDLYSLLLPSGRSIELAGGFTADPLSTFTGTLAVPGAGTGATLTGAERRTTLHRATTDRQPMEVLSSRTTSSKGVAPAATTHTTYVARVTNFSGTFGVDDSQILGVVSSAQQYWVRESSGMIPTWSTASGVVPVASDVSSAGCGLGGGGADFGAITQNVGAKAFPGVDFSGASPNHLVIVVPDGCGGGTTGRARLGTSFASGGPTIVQAQSRVETLSTLNHEWGHNVGLEHANNAGAEYGDLYEVMGADDGTWSSPVLGTVYRWEQGIVGAGEAADASAGIATQTLQPRSATSGLRSVIFIHPDTGVRHFVDYRTGEFGTCYSSGSCTSSGYGQSYTTGVVVEREDADSGAFLVTGGDGALQSGEQWTNGRVTVRANSANGVQVTLAPASGDISGGTVSISAPTALRDVVATPSAFSPSPNGYRYQWTLDGQPIAGAESREFRPTAAMTGGQLGVTVTAYATGRNPAARASATQAVAPAGWYKSRTSRDRPELVGTAQVGRTLSVAGMDWVNYYGERPADLTTTYEWVRDGSVIPGASASSYTLTAADVGRQVYAREYPRAAGYLTTSYATTPTSASVLQGRLVTQRPKIAGKAKVGAKVVARVKGWTSGTRFSYQWYLGKKAIKKATKKKLVITRAMRGKKLVVKVTGKKAGYKKASVRSRPAKVK